MFPWHAAPPVPPMSWRRWRRPAGPSGTDPARRAPCGAALPMPQSSASSAAPVLVPGVCGLSSLPLCHPRWPCAGAVRHSFPPAPPPSRVCFQLHATNLDTKAAVVNRYIDEICKYFWPPSVWVGGADAPPGIQSREPARLAIRGPLPAMPPPFNDGRGFPLDRVVHMMCLNL